MPTKHSTTAGSGKQNKNRDNLQLQSLCHSLPATIIAIITIAIIIITNLARYR